MKKKVVLIIGIIVVLICILILIINNSKKEVEISDKNVCTISSFTLTDTGTEIEVRINNSSKENINLSKLHLDLYDSSNNKIKYIEKSLDNEVKPNSNVSIKINEKDKYPSVAKLECSVYKIN